MKKVKYVILGFIGAVSLFFCIVMIITIKETINDYRCTQLSIEEFKKDLKCKRYWNYKIESVKYGNTRK